mgnify:CR=1 FL=1
MSKNRIIRFITNDGVHQLYLLDATSVLADIGEIRPLSKVAFLAMANMVCVSLLRSNNLKGASQTLSFQIDTTSDLKKAIATSNAKGEVKGYVQNPDAADPIGASMISCTADLGLKAPYHSSVFVDGDTLEERINSFFSQSDQTTLLYASNIVDPAQASIKALLYHHLPVEGGEDYSFDLDKARTLLEKPLELEDIAEGIFEGKPFEKVSEEPVRFHCDCSRKRFEGLLATLSDEELKELSSKIEPTVTTCGWCGKTYSFSPSEIKILYSKRHS